jgi:hypothetical protein
MTWPQESSDLQRDVLDRFVDGPFRIGDTNLSAMIFGMPTDPLLDYLEKTFADAYRK